MRVQSGANLFLQQNSALEAGSKKSLLHKQQKKPADDLLNRLANNMVSTQTQD